MSNQRSLYRSRTSLKAGAMLLVLAVAAALSSGQVRGAMLDSQLGAWAPQLAKLARISGFMQVPGSIVQQGDTRTVPAGQAKPGAPQQGPLDDRVSILVKTVPGLSDEAVDALIQRHGA